MKKNKSLFGALAFFILLIYSCSNEESISYNEEASTENILNFASEKEMEAKIKEIQNFKQNQEKVIMQKILDKHNLTAPTLEGIKRLEVVDASKIDETTLLEDVKFYHNLKLEAIKEERAYFGFTSIQSIADEINFSKLLNPEKSNQLFESYRNKLNRNEYHTSPKQGNNISNVINSKGKTYINGESNYFEVQNDSEISRIPNQEYTEQGVLATYPNLPGPVTSDPFFYVVWFSGYSNNILFTQIASYVKINSQLQPYPMYYFINENSKAYFNPYNNCNAGILSLDFHSGANTFITVNYGSSPLGCSFPSYEASITGQVGGAFAAQLGASWVSFIGADQF